MGRREEALDHVSGLDGGEGGRGQEQAGVVVFEVEDLDRAAVGELRGGGLALPYLVGEGGLEAGERAFEPLVRLGEMRSPWRLRIRQMVASEASGPSLAGRWRRMVWGPASKPPLSSWWPSRTISATTSWEVRARTKTGQIRGRTGLCVPALSNPVDRPSALALQLDSRFPCLGRCYSPSRSAPGLFRFRDHFECRPEERRPRVRPQPPAASAGPESAWLA